MATNLTLSDGDILKLIPDYYGDPQLLDNFIDIVEYVGYHFRDYPPEQRKLLSLHIKGKVKGEAGQKLAGLISDSWDELKTQLKRLFRECKNETTLKRELFEIPSKNFTISETYSKLTQIINSYSARVDSSNETLEVKRALKTSFLNDSIDVFTRTLPEPLRSQIISRNPNSPAEIYDYILNKTDELHKEKSDANKKTQNFNKPQNFNKSYNKNNYSNFRPNPNYQQNFNTHYYKNSYQPRQTFQPRQNYSQRYFFPRPQYSNEHKPSRQFQNYNYYDETPMSTQTIPTKSRYKEQEMLNTEASNGKQHFLGKGQNQWDQR